MQETYYRINPYGLLMKNGKLRTATNLEILKDFEAQDKPRRTP